MNARPDIEYEWIDRRTWRSICDAVGERLQQSMPPETVPSERLQHLLHELRQRDLQRL